MLSRLNIYSVLAAFAIGFGVFPAAAEILETSLSIGETWTVVREVRRVHLRVGEQELYFDRIPAEADLSTLILRTRRGILDLLEWERVGVHESAGSFRDASAGRPSGEDGRDASREKDRTGKVRCQVYTLLSGARTVELTYRVQGLSWRAEYQASIHGDPEETGETVSVDLSGALHIRNDTTRDYERADIRLVGAEPPETDDRSHAGFLALEPGPLAALWDPPEPETRPEHLYRIPQPVTLPAQSETEITYATTRRVPARWRHVLYAGEVPLTVRGALHPLRRFLVIDPEPEHRLGWALPPGPVTVFHGDRRHPSLQDARLPHTPDGTGIWIDCGLEEDVRGWRRTVARTAVTDGHYEETFEIAIQNNRPYEIVVEIRERPHRVLSWEVVRAAAPYERQLRRLHFDLAVPGETERRLEYRLRFHEPAL